MVRRVRQNIDNVDLSAPSKYFSLVYHALITIIRVNKYLYAYSKLNRGC